MISWRSIPGAQRAAHYVGTQVASATARAAASRSTTAAQAISTVGQGAELVSATAGTGLGIIATGMHYVGRSAGLTAAAAVSAPAAVLTGVAYAADLVSLPLALGVGAASLVGFYHFGQWVARRAAAALVGDRVSMVKDVADAVADVCKDGTDAAASMAAKAEKERLAA